MNFKFKFFFPLRIETIIMNNFSFFRLISINPLSVFSFLFFDTKNLKYHKYNL